MSYSTAYWSGRTHRSDFVQERHAFALDSVELQLVELGCNSLQDLTCQQRTAGKVGRARVSQKAPKLELPTLYPCAVLQQSTYKLSLP